MAAQSKHLRGVKASPSLTFYGHRSNGDLVLLIAVDQLPPSVNLVGIPRTLRADQVFGLRHVGELPDTEGNTFQLESNAPIPWSSSNPPVGPTHRHEYSAGGSTQSLNPVASYHRPSTSHGAVPYPTPQSSPFAAQSTQPTWRSKPVVDSDSFIKALINTEQGARRAQQVGYIPKIEEPLPPSGNKIDPDKKRYCTHWIRHGECDYMQQGCRYMHVMPNSATLLSIGFKATPRWYIEEKAKYTASGKLATVPGMMKSSTWLKSITKDDSQDKSADVENRRNEASSSVAATLVSDPTKHVDEVKKTSNVDWRARAPVTKQDEPATSAAASDQPSAQSAPHEDSTTGDLIDFKDAEPLPTPPTTSANMPTVEKEQMPMAETTSALPPGPPTLAIQTRPALNVLIPATTAFAQVTTNPASEAKANGAPQSQQASVDGGTARPSRNHFGRQKGRLNQNREGQGLLASMHAPADSDVRNPRPVHHRPCRVRGGRRFHELRNYVQANAGIGVDGHNEQAGSGQIAHAQAGPGMLPSLAVRGNGQTTPGQTQPVNAGPSQVGSGAGSGVVSG